MTDSLPTPPVREGAREAGARILAEDPYSTGVDAFMRGASWATPNPPAPTGEMLRLGPGGKCGECGCDSGDHFFDPIEPVCNTCYQRDKGDDTKRDAAFHHWTPRTPGADVREALEKARGDLTEAIFENDGPLNMRWLNTTTLITNALATLAPPPAVKDEETSDE